jgi:hypothetical protein
VPLDQPERATEQVDARGDQRRPQVVVVEDQGLDQVVQVALVVRDVDDAAAPRRPPGDLDVLPQTFDLAQDGVEGVLEGAVDGVSLRRPELVQVGLDSLPGVELRLAVAGLQVPRYVLMGQYRPGQVVLYRSRL